MPQRLQLRLALLLLFVTWCGIIGRSAAQDDPGKLREQIVAQLTGVISKYTAKSLPADEVYERAAKLVVIDPQMITFVGGRLTWQIRPRRKLAVDEQISALRDIERWLRVVFDQRQATGLVD